MGKPDLSDYVEVSERIAKLREKHPDASLQAEIVRWPDNGFPFIVAQAFCYRTPDDPRPGVGWAAEPFPGRTPYTKDSETQNAETSAWGRAIVAALAADTKKGIASAEEIRSRAASEEDGGKTVREAPSERVGKGAARTSGNDGARGTGKAPESPPSPDTPGGAEVTASASSGSTPSGEAGAVGNRAGSGSAGTSLPSEPERAPTSSDSPSGGADTTPSAPPDPPDEATMTFLEALDAALKNAFGTKATLAAAFMRDFLKRAGVDAASKLSEQSRVALLEQLAEKAGAKA